MKLYGHVESNNTGAPLELDAVSICFHTPKEAVKFAEFALSCAKGMELWGDDYGHDHFAGGEVPDITIERLLDANR